MVMLASPAQENEITIRRELRPGDAQAIVDLHRRVYCPEYERNEQFVTAVAESLAGRIALGWPAAGGAVWLVERGGRVAGSMGLTIEGQGVGQIRWVVLEPSLRGHGLGRALLDEALTTARAAGMRMLRLDTFSALKAAGHLYRQAGFRVVWERERDDWGPRITYQGYELHLR
jgi:ribosomal protein S18 acetylase RimI-like enzyme